MISVIIPYKNAGEWLKQCADSLTKNRGEFEFIFINDNSTDGGEDILKEYDDDRFVLIDNQRHKGVSGARNTGLDIASGEWITFLDADDELLPNAAKKFNSLLKADAEIHQANHSRLYASGKTVTKYRNDPGYFTLGNLLSCQCWQVVWNKIFKADLIKDIRFDETMQYGEDELFVLECMARADKLHHGREVIVIHCFKNQKSLARIKKETDLWRHVRALEKYIKTHETKARRTACLVLSEHWKSRVILDGIGGKNEKD